jgi:hypothetical protein
MKMFAGLPLLGGYETLLDGLYTGVRHRIAMPDSTFSPRLVKEEEAFSRLRLYRVGITP